METKTAEAKLTLYYSKYCYFCQKVLTFMRGRELDVELRNTSDREHAQALMAGGGKTQVPCLRIKQANGEFEWMFESDDIIQYLS